MKTKCLSKNLVCLELDFKKVKIQLINAVLELDKDKELVLIF
jgi:hypothetical protein